MSILPIMSGIVQLKTGNQYSVNTIYNKQHNFIAILGFLSLNIILTYVVLRAQVRD